jgi:hypothetical protein
MLLPRWSMRILLACVVLSISATGTASAQGVDVSRLFLPDATLALGYTQSPLLARTAGAAIAEAAQSDFDLGRPPLLVPMYVSLIALQSADAALTVRGLDLGLRERNPLMRGGVGMTVTKVLGTATVMLVTEKMWRRNRLAAIATIVAANMVSGAVVWHNARLVGSQPR